MPTGTPFHSRTSRVCESQDWRNWSGYFAAGTYQPSHEHEYYSIRNSAGLIDVSPLFKYEVTGPDSLRLVDRIMTRNISKCRIGQVMYTPWCDEDGKLIEDGTVSRLAEDHFRLTAADPSLRWFQDCGYGMDATVTDVSSQLGALALQGPTSRKLLESLVSDADIGGLKYFRLTRGRIDDIPVTVTRTGYTGDLGYELWVRSRWAERLWDILIENGRSYGVTPAGMVALDIARIEAGLLLIEVDFFSSQKTLIELQKSSPFEVGLGWAVALKKKDFIGRDALIREKNLGSAWTFVGLEVDWVHLERLFEAIDLPPLVAGRASRAAVPIYQNGKQIGQATSQTFSPILKKYIAIGTVRAGSGSPGSKVEMEVTVEYERQRVSATIVKTPFFNPPRKRA